eukprot:TRINITY_DN191_c0_g1_i1.p1 TRINITY_DN191_c0_g1~~TRINITY_DN191_c0_g1_i1.p1  ORF type:complete len:397 (-),score=115.08 TRINITY_DN191_c0_g1_i1:316-1506(-)
MYPSEHNYFVAPTYSESEMGVRMMDSSSFGEIIDQYHSINESTSAVEVISFSDEMMGSVGKRDSFFDTVGSVQFMHDSLSDSPTEVQPIFGEESSEVRHLPSRDLSSDHQNESDSHENESDVAEDDQHDCATVESHDSDHHHHHHQYVKDVKDVPVHVSDAYDMDDDDESTTWRFIPADGKPVDVVRNIRFLLKSKREKSWRKNMLPRMFLTSRYVIQWSFSISPKRGDVDDAMDDPDDGLLSIRLRLVNADSLNHIENGLLCPDAIPAVGIKGIGEMTAEVSYKCRTNSHLHGNAYFRLEARIGTYGRMYSPRFRILARRPAGDNVGRVYADMPIDEMGESARPHLDRSRGRVASFLSDPRNIEKTARDGIFDSFCKAIKCLPSSEIDDLIKKMK